MSEKQQVENRTAQEILAKLSEPMADNEIEWKVQTVTRGNQGLQALVVPYVTSRAAMQRLDDVFGLNWSCSEKVIELNGVSGIQCTISVTDEQGNVITSRSDVAEPTQIEKLKGGSSDAFKRAAVKFGIGRFLYSLPMQFVPIHENRPQGKNIERINSNYKVSGQQMRVTGYYIRPSVSAILSKTNQPQPARQSNQNNQGAPRQNQPQQNPNPTIQNQNGRSNPLSQQELEDLNKARNIVEQTLSFFNLKSHIGNVFTQLGMPHITTLENANFNELLHAHQLLSPTMVLFEEGFKQGFSDIQIYQICSQVLNTNITSYTDLFGKFTHQHRKLCTERLLAIKAQSA